jgi:hypothetical protein
MGALCTTPHNQATLQLTAVSSQSGEQLIDHLNWQLMRNNLVEAESHVIQPTFNVPPGTYELIVHYKSITTKVHNINLKPYTLLDQIVRIGQVRNPDSYHIDHEEEFNPSTEHERRKLDRKSQNYIGHDDTLKIPPTSEQLRQQKQALQRAHLGPMAHPILSHMAQFDGAVEPEVNPVPSENPDTINDLYERYEHQLDLAMQPAFNPKPSTPNA